ncbi:ArnT family glycosyltransferase [Nocardia bovistercoris]|uniref:Glycosyltransferase family 39 protein n=1 Tax=Nocardia bovistercoris TaxID=2785916 RepID=A0A931IBG4_9NOCA|nr:glycosyltransferase family 39 protein [Nocardia bovistercoris]MBH0777433.1 glycosyltransferase family 39 protein [Nocardia bovistercoris]
MTATVSVPEAAPPSVLGPRATPRARSGADPRWARPTLIVLLAATAALYLTNLSVSGWGNEYYAAAAQAGSRSPLALLFGSHDAGNAITVDKPPAALWLMSLSARLFGFGPWSVLIPQALLGIASVALLHAAVRRWSGPGAGLLAGAALAATPVAALMFRYDNPDALLTFLLIAAAYCTVRAIDAEGARWWSSSTGWLVLAAVAIGFGFLTKLLQALLVLPALAAVFLIAAAGGFWSRTVKLVTAGAALVLAGGWFVVLVEVWPASARPYIGGSTNNSLWELTLGYNGLGRLLGGRGNPGGNADGPSAGGRMGAAFGGDTGITRLFRDLMATEVSWLLPAALIGAVCCLWARRRAPRADRLRAAVIVWGGWLFVTAIVFSYMSGVIHPYYTVALAPAVDALFGISVATLWRGRAHAAARAALALMATVTGVWSFALLGHTPEWLPWLRWTALCATALGAIGLLTGPRLPARVTAAAAVTALVAGLSGAAAYSIVTTSFPHSGGIPASGPRGDAMAAGPQPGVPGPRQARGQEGPGQVSGGPGTGQAGGVPAGPGQGDSRATASDTSDYGDPALVGQRMAEGGRAAGAPAPGPPGPGGHPGIAPNAELEDMLRASDRRWTAATVGSFGASALELRTGTSVMAIGGFGGGDEAPTLEQFRTLVADGAIGYFVTTRDAGPRPPRPDGAARESAGELISEWVRSHYTSREVGAVTVYDLTRAPAF